MRKDIFFILLLFLSVFNLSAQKRDNTWILGYYGGEPGPTEDTLFGVQRLLFDSSIPKTTKFFQAKFNINEANTSISDKEGNLLFFFNGRNLYNGKLELAKGENNINVDSINFLSNAVTPQNGIFLPFPGNENKTILCSKRFGLSKKKEQLLVHDIDFNVAILNNFGKNGLGEVEFRRINILHDTLDLGKITAVKHANGRDWWVILQRYYDNVYYKILIDTNNVRIYDSQKLGLDSCSTFSQNTFTPNGEKFICYENRVEIGNPHIIIFDFNRCSGELSNPYNIFLDRNEDTGGCAVSPNSRFLYTSFGTEICQFDLWAKDISATKKVIGIYDGFLFLNFYKTAFYLAQLAPNGKIYISTSGSSPYLHVINNPDLEGAACNFVQRGLKLPFVNAWGIPNHPNYRLGALKGSPCDTLKSVTTQDIDNQELVQIFPNPTNDILNISVANNNPATLIIRDISSRVIESITFTTQTTISTANYFNGMIFCEIWQDNQRISTERIVIQH